MAKNKTFYELKILPQAVSQSVARSETQIQHQQLNRQSNAHLNPILPGSAKYLRNQTPQNVNNKKKHITSPLPFEIA
jgi:hypothetical protein